MLASARSQQNQSTKRMLQRPRSQQNECSSVLAPINFKKNFNSFCQFFDRIHKNPPKLSQVLVLRNTCNRILL